MSDLLTTILEAKRTRLTSEKKLKPIDSVRSDAFAVRAEATSHLLRTALSRPNRFNVIAEFKRRSPSKGVIREGASPSAVARAYEAGGAVAVSVLTEKDYFDGSLKDLGLVREAVSLPILRKDFIFDEYQVYESAAVGADAVLLIVAALNDESLVQLRELAENELGLDALVEVHTEEEMRRALASGATLIGVNNRDLKTFQVSLDTSIELAEAAAPETILVSESGLHTRDDLRRLSDAGFSGFLIGESLMREDDPAKALRLLTALPS